MATRTRHNLVLEPASGLADLAEAGGQYQHHGNPVLTALVDNRGNPLGRCRYNGQVDAFSGVGEGSERRPILDRVMLRVDGDDRTGKACFEQVSIDDATDRIGPIAGAKKRDAARRKQRLEVMCRHVFLTQVSIKVAGLLHYVLTN